MQGDEQVLAGLDPEPRRGPGGAEAVLERDQGVDHRVADEVHALLGDALGAQVLDRLVAVQEEVARRAASATIRLISSGIVRSKLRRPDSMWATGMPSFAAVSAAASVELTSPGTITRSGRSSSRTGSRRSIMRAVCCGVAAGADLEHVVGRRHAELLEEDLRHQPVVVLAGVDDRVAARRAARARSAAITGAVLTKFGRVPTT